MYVVSLLVVTSYLVAPHLEADGEKRDVELRTAADPEAADGVGGAAPREGVDLNQVVLKQQEAETRPCCLPISARLPVFEALQVLASLTPH